MFSTRSTSQRAPATDFRAILVSHGQPSDPDPAEAALKDFTERVRRVLADWQVESATLAKPGALDSVLGTTGPDPIIYPFFMTEGWFTGDALLERLDGRPARILPPFGLDPNLPAMTVSLLNKELSKRGWRARDTRLFIAAHGSGRSPNSSRDTQRFAKALADIMRFEEIRVGFVEQRPNLADAALDLGPRAICLPFFAARGGHVLEDLPEALKQAAFSGVCLDPIGCAPGAPQLVAQALETAERQRARA